MLIGLRLNNARLKSSNSFKDSEMKIIDLDKWKRKKSYEWFSKFSDPTYVLSAKIDVTRLISFTRMHKLPFFENMLYLTTCALNRIPALRLRVKGDKIIEYDKPAPSFTIALEDGLFDISRVEWNDDPSEFCKDVRRLINQAKSSCGNKEFGDSNVDVYYFTCLPWLDFETMTNPIPDDKEIAAIPRICWGKYVLADGKFMLSLSIQVSHALVDGKPLCDAFAEIQKCIDDCEELIKV